MSATLPPPRSRNDPCPCGSGRRYKHCHGSDAPPDDGYVAPDPALGPLEAARTAIRAGRHAEAVAVLDAARVEQGTDPAALRLLGEALRPSDAVRSRACWLRVADSAPDDPEAHFFLGELDREAGDLDGAIAHFELALARAPEHPGLLNNLGLALDKAGRLAEAEANFRRMLEVVPDALNALANLAQNLYQQRRYKESVALFDQLVERMPTAPIEVWGNYGIAQRMCGLLTAAEKSLIHATELDATQASPWHNLGLTYYELQQHGRAAIALRRSFELDPTNLITEAMLLHSNGHQAYWKDYAALRADVIEGARGNPAEISERVLAAPFPFLGICDDPALQLNVARRWSVAEFLAARPLRPPRRASDGRLRLGFASADLYGHPVGRLIVGLFERLDRKRFQVIAYSTSKDKDDGVRRRIEANVDRFRSFPVVDAFEIAEAMREDGTDVAFDLTGYTAGAVMSVMQLRPAPVQINFLGYTGTLGSSVIDWIVTDRYCVPPGEERHLEERPLFVDPCYLPSDVARIPSEDTLTRAMYDLPADVVVFASHVGMHKIVPEHFDAMLDILSGVPGSVLWLRKLDSIALRRLELLMEARGLDPGRLRCAPNELVPRYLKRFGLADLFLDSMPFGGHTTVNDALFSGLPVLAVAGQSFAARASASQVMAVGLPELVATSRDDYVRRAIALGNDRPRLAAMAAQLRETRDRLPLFDLDRYARAFEEAIERAWRETPET